MAIVLDKCYIRAAYVCGYNISDFMEGKIIS